MQEKLRQIMSRNFKVPVEKITAEAQVETIESWDSLNHINLILALEKEFGCTFAPEEIVNMVSYSAICEILQQKTQSAGKR